MNSLSPTPQDDMPSHTPLAQAFRYVQDTHRNIFLTGKAGTGKTTFLRHVVATTRKRVIVVAPTGVAAINAGGVTIHSFFQIAPGLHVPGLTTAGSGDRQHGFQLSRQKINILRTLDLLIIDEVSMVRADLLDAIDEVLRRYQDRRRPFGGVQLLLIGDMQQLAPVATDAEWDVLRGYYKTPYFFDSHALAATPYVTIELTTVYRQADKDFIDILNAVRDNRLDPATLARLNARYRPRFQPDDREGYITLTTHNYQAQSINRAHLAALAGTPLTYTACVGGDFPATAYPTDEALTLKVGAQVMFCKNDTSAGKQYYNGRIGHVVGMDDKSVTVACPPDEKSVDRDMVHITVEPQVWTNTRYVTNPTTGVITEEVAGTFTQIPLKTAWAITIHKSQGLTFDHAVIDAGYAFSHGQVYVALSRCRTLDGLVLSTPITPDVLIGDADIDRFNATIVQNRPTDEQMKADERQNVTDILCALFDYTALQYRMDYVTRLVDEHLGRRNKKFAARCRETAEAVRHDLAEVGVRFQQVIRATRQKADPREDAALQARAEKGLRYYQQKTDELMAWIFDATWPEIGNKVLKKRIEDEKTALLDEYTLRQAYCRGLAQRFSVDDYWDIKARTRMQTKSAAPKRSTKKMSTRRK